MKTIKRRSNMYLINVLERKNRLFILKFMKIINAVIQEAQ